VPLDMRNNCFSLRKMFHKLYHQRSHLTIQARFFGEAQIAAVVEYGHSRPKTSAKVESVAVCEGAE
jgi:hypothetical protein